MKRPCIAIRFKKHNSLDRRILTTVLAESFLITSTGYVAINCFDGGYNSVHKAEDIVSVSIIEKHSVFPDLETLELHKSHYPSIYNPTYGIKDWDAKKK